MLTRSRLHCGIVRNMVPDNIVQEVEKRRIGLKLPGTKHFSMHEAIDRHGRQTADLLDDLWRDKGKSAGLLRWPSCISR